MIRDILCVAHDSPALRYWFTSELERLEEGEQLLLYSRTQVAEMSGYMLGLAEVAFDRILQCQRSEIVHVPWPHPQSPQCGRAQFVGGVRRGSLHNPVSGLDVVQQEVAVRMDDLVAARLGTDEHHT